MKHKRSKRKMSDKKALTIIIAVACAAALLIAALVVIGPILGGNNADPHAGHNHSNNNLGDGHYEGDGHDHGSTTGDKVTYRLYTNGDKTYRLVLRDNAGKTLGEFDKLPKQPIKATINETAGIYELGWATDNGPNDFECVYYNVKTGQVSEKFVAPRGTDGVRIAYGSADQTKIIVQDLFDKNAYYKEHALQNTKADKNGDIIVSGSLKADKKTIVIAYHSTESADAHATVKLYD